MSLLDSVTLEALIELVAERVAERVAAKIGSDSKAGETVEYLTLREAAAFTRIGESTLRRRILEGDLRALRNGNRIRLSVADLRALMDRTPVPPAAEDDLEIQRVVGRLRKAS